jgi:hypothetical protein
VTAPAAYHRRLSAHRQVPRHGAGRGACVVRRVAIVLVKTMVPVGFLVLLWSAACSTPERQVSLKGSYTGSGLKDDGYSLVEGLEVTEIKGQSRLTAYMNDTNQEAGMDQISNSRSLWTGQGSMRGDSLVFVYKANGVDRKGSLEANRSGFLLTLDGRRYQLIRSDQ